MRPTRGIPELCRSGPLGRDPTSQTWRDSEPHRNGREHPLGPVSFPNSLGSSESGKASETLGPRIMSEPTGAKSRPEGKLLPQELGMDWVARVQDFCRTHVRPFRTQIDRDDRFPPELREALQKSGLLGLTVPREYGGAGLSTREFVRVLEELSAESPALATLVSVHLGVVCHPLLEFGTEQQKRLWLPRLASGDWIGAFALTEPDAGSDAQRIRLRYHRDAAGYTLNGTKMFISSAETAHVLLTFATRDPGLGARGISCFLVPKGPKGPRIAQRLDKMGDRGSDTCEVVFEDCPVPEDGLLGEEGRGFSIAMRALEAGRVGIAALSVGVARSAFERMREFVKGDPSPWKQAALARAYVEVEASRALVHRAAQLRDQGDDFGMAASAAKLLASTTAFRIASQAIDVGGRATAARDHPSGIEQVFRDARVLTIVEGTTEIQELILGRRLSEGHRAATLPGSGSVDPP